MRTALNSDTFRAPAQASTETAFQDEYLLSLNLIERLHRLLLDVIKDEFDRNGGSDINSVQALLLYNMADSELTPGELKKRGYYLGSNVSYNLKRLVELGYVCHKRSDTDKRLLRIRLTQKGKAAGDIVAKLYLRQVGTIEAVGQVNSGDVKDLNRSLMRLERFWSDQIRYRT